MKSLLLPTADGGEWWVVTHQLSLANARVQKLRPIHVLTYLAQSLIAPPQRAGLYMRCLALENKLYAVRLFHFELRKAVAEYGDPIYPATYVRDYEEEQRIIAHLEAYLNSIYTSLEIAAQINRSLNPDLPIGFRSQSKRFAAFSFMAWQFLPHFYDVRSELTHFGSTLPSLKDGKLLIEFSTPKRLELFARGRAEIPILDILRYSVDLFSMLDSWAEEQLKRLNPKDKVTTAFQKHPNAPLTHRDTSISSILRLLKNPRRNRVPEKGQSSSG